MHDHDMNQNALSNMMDDIERYAAMMDNAFEKGVFKDEKKETPAEVAQDDEQSNTDFFGQYIGDEYDIDRPLNEVDSKYWALVAKMADPLGKDIITESKEEVKEISDALAKSHNPIYPNTVGKDQDVKITQNWGVGGKEHFQLEDLKVRLEKLESKLNAIESEGQSGKSTQDKIDDLKKQIDELSNSLSGERFSSEG